MNHIFVNGERKEVPQNASVEQLLRELKIDMEAGGVAVAVGESMVPRAAWAGTQVKAGDRVEIIKAVGGGALTPVSDEWKLGGRTLTSRLILGTSQYPSLDMMLKCLVASGARVATVAIRRVKLNDTSGENIFNLLKSKNIEVLPNTAGCYTSKEAVLTAELAREALGTDWIKLEVIGDDETLFPDVEQLLKAAAELIKKGFIVLPYCNDDPITCKKLEDLGCVAVMPLGAPIGSGMGIRNPYNLRIIREMVKVPVIVDAGVGTASDAAIAMELGCDGLLMNSAVARARDPLKMAEAMRKAAEAGRLAYLAGRIPKKLYASASSPLEGLMEAP